MTVVITRQNAEYCLGPPGVGGHQITTLAARLSDDAIAKLANQRRENHAQKASYVLIGILAAVIVTQWAMPFTEAQGQGVALGNSTALFSVTDGRIMRINAGHTYILVNGFVLTAIGRQNRSGRFGFFEWAESGNLKMDVINHNEHR